MKGIDKLPEWILSGDWAVGRDSLNWKLYRCSEKGNWKVVGYYPTVQVLAKSLHRKLERELDKQGDLYDHLMKCSVVFEEHVEELYKKLGLVVGVDGK